MAILALAVFFSSGMLDTSGVVQQLLRGFIPFSYAPFLIPIAHYFWPAVKPTMRTWIGFAAYLFFVIVLSMALNQRAAFVLPLITLTGGIVLAVLTERLKVNLFRPRVAILAGVLVFLVAPTLGDIATAMRVARLHRSYSSTGDELVGSSISAFFDKKKLRDYRNTYVVGNSRAGDWDERYLENEFLQRLTLLKYTDNSLYYTSAFGPTDIKGLTEFSNKRFLALFPAPLLRALGIYFNKWSVSTMSFGDYIYYARTGFQYAGFRTGSFIGNEKAMHGNWFFLGACLVAFAAFFLIDSFSRLRTHQVGRTPAGDPILRKNFEFSPVVLIFFYTFVFFFSSESFVTQIGVFVRTVPQTLALYLLLFHSSRILNILTPKPALPTLHAPGVKASIPL